MLYSWIKKYLKKITIQTYLYFQPNKNLNLLDYWEERVKKYGKMSVEVPHLLSVGEVN
ncbi:MAG: hypothetical protein IM333_16530 [Microcystis sp. M048S1]|uniref:hypothetical protein n=1 Tax=unclassified Microcystis TaxID=2643300 RepID=UPI00257FB432|nr:MULTISPECIES: hypothetical protein [unclassified Microcystis]MCA2724990.1 hypothetical protein [Microcystis sp. M166S2]MCA2894450.1 hypothetical protein [Microcystis sp. M048S1]MCA2724000.1 hypothetical protein [Microcystis sp. M176S2]MCA2748548.1 hypothetical protein [Microcystis sp. M155S2]MCA2769365.1 hypothetical protein [Microcystis sp. M152S2]